MRVDLTDTSASRIDAALTRERHRNGIPAVGVVLTFVLLTDEASQADAVRAATAAAREHPSRILAMTAGAAEGDSRLDAEIHAGPESGPAETVLARLHGPLQRHSASVVLPLLLPDAPVVAWWLGPAPQAPGEEQVGALAQRRITDAAATGVPAGTVLAERARGYRAGDTDLAWARLTGWRALLAAALDQQHGEITRGVVWAHPANPSAPLLAAWLSDKLGVDVDRKASHGPGITATHLELDHGEIAITRPDGRVATLSRPGQPDREVGLHRRSTAELLVEELRWLDTDEVYGETIASAARDLAGRPQAAGAGAPGRGPAESSPGTASR